MARRTAIIAHRGGAKLWPENSRRALAGARSLAVDGIEVDVHLTKDDEVVILHDPTLDRTTTASGPVRQVNAKALADVGVRDRSGAVVERGLPFLDDLIETCADTAMTLSIELKCDVDDARYPGLAKKVVAALDRNGARGRAFVHAFDWGYLEELRALAPDLALGGNVERETLTTTRGLFAALDRLVALDVRDVNIDHRLMDAELVREAQDRGLGVTLWTVNDADELERFLKSGADTLVTDRPDLALALRRAFMDEIGLRA